MQCFLAWKRIYNFLEYYVQFNETDSTVDVCVFDGLYDIWFVKWVRPI